MKRVVLLAAALSILRGLGGSPLPADGVVYRVKDINPGATLVAGGDCGSFRAVGSLGLFSATSPGAGCELFRTRGWISSTVLVDELVLGTQGSDPRFLGSVGPRALFLGNSPETGAELWATDGTAAGTGLLGDFLPGPDAPEYADFTELGDLAIFYTCVWDPTAELPVCELRRTDGTPAGTGAVLALNPAPNTQGDEPRRALRFGDFALLSAALGPTWKAELWRSDGTAAGTTLVADLWPEGSSSPSGFAQLGDEAYFFASGPSDRSLWRTDGTAAGTGRVFELQESYDAPPSDLVAAGGRLFFAADDRVHGRELWATDGTPAGTAMIREIVPGPGGATVVEITAAGTRIYFFADDGDHGLEPWVSDGTAAGTHLVADVNPGDASSYVYDYDTPRIVARGEKAMFAADDGVHGAEPWFTDGTGEGTALLGDFTAGEEGSYPDLYGPFGDRLLFSAVTGGSHRELYLTDGTAAGTEVISALGQASTPSGPGNLLVAGGLLYLEAWSELPWGTRYWPWRTDGSEEGTFPLVGDLGWYPGSRIFEGLPDLALGITVGDDDGDVLWSADGIRINPIRRFVEECGHHVCGLGELPRRVGDLALFSWSDLAHGDELWSTNGKLAGTGFFFDIWPSGFGSSYPGGFQPFFDGQLLFLANDGAHGVEPWVTAGSPATTHLLADLEPGPDSSPYWEGLWPFDAAGPTLFGPRRVYEPDDYHAELDVIELAGGQVARIERLGPDFDPWQMYPLGRIGDRELFRASPSEGPNSYPDYELWASDGTAEGTGLVRDIWPGPVSSRAARGVVVGDRLLFPACDPAGGCELWASDGTEAGTARVADLVPGWRSSFPSGLAAVAGRVYFAACQEDTGCEPWITDGTAAGTHRVADIAPGPVTSVWTEAPEEYSWSAPEDPRQFVPYEGRVYFAADDGKGSELWAMLLEIFYDGFETGDLSRWDPPTPP